MRRHRILLINIALIAAIALALASVLVPSWLPAGPEATMVIAPSPDLLPSPVVSLAPSLAPNPSPFTSGPLVSLEPSSSPSPSPAPSFPSAVPTRVTIASLGIDLPIIAAALTETFPFCNVAEYIPSFGLPGGNGITYLYAHARAGMFGPLLVSVLNNGPASLIGRSVLVYTADDTEYRYKIDAVFPHVLDWTHASVAPAGDLILQTSETASHTGTKLMVRAALVGTIANQTAATALTPHPLVCY